jgi:hypothetical protein
MEVGSHLDVSSLCSNIEVGSHLDVSSLCSNIEVGSHLDVSSLCYNMEVGDHMTIFVEYESRSLTLWGLGQGCGESIPPASAALSKPG